MQQKIIILDFGSQTTQLIGRRVRELDTFCEILPYNKFPKDDPSVIGVILSGSPYSVHDKEAFKVDLNDFIGKYPVLGICYGAQYMAQHFGGKVEPAASREYGRANLQTIEHDNPLFKDFIPNSQVWMSHGDTITAIPDHFRWSLRRCRFVGGSRFAPQSHRRSPHLYFRRPRLAPQRRV